MLKDAPIIDRNWYHQNKTFDEMLDIVQALETKAYHNRQLFEYACKDHCHDLLEVETELLRAGIPEDDGYGCYAPGERVRMLAKQIKS